MYCQRSFLGSVLLCWTLLAGAAGVYTENSYQP